MLVLVQWSTDPAQDWQQVNVDAAGQAARAWRNLPTKPEPDGTDVIDSTPGWIYDLNIQGLHLGGYDHYSVAPVAQGIQATIWNDDPEDWPEGTQHAQVWTFLAPQPDPRIGGRVNTRQSLTRYLAPNAPPHLFRPVVTTMGPATLLPWTDFVPPAQNITRHGIWLPEQLELDHIAVQTVWEWPRWTTGG